MTIDFNRRTLGKAATILSVSLGAPMLAGCSGPQHHADNRMMPGTVFTPEALKATAKGKTYVRDFVAVYGRPLRRMNDHVRHPDQKGYVWEWVATRPSFCSNLNDRPYMTPTVKKEIHVWRRNSDAVVTDVEVVGTFYVQVKHKMLPLVITDIRPLTRDELTASRAGAVKRSATMLINSLLPATYPPVEAIPPPKFFIKDPTTTSAPMCPGSNFSTSSP